MQRATEKGIEATVGCNTGVLRVSPYPYSWTVNTGNQSIRGRTAAAKSLQSCLTLCDPIDGGPPGSPIPGSLQQEHRGYQTEPDKPLCSVFLAYAINAYLSKTEFLVKQTFLHELPSLYLSVPLSFA